jgi:hypothetical protein
MKIQHLAVYSGFGFVALMGLTFARAGMQEIAKVRSRRKHLLRITGTVLTVMKKREYRVGNSSERGRDVVKFFPYIAFTKPDGGQERFESESGACYEVRRKFGGGTIEPVSPWCDGQNIEIFYDPGGVLKPCLADGFSLYGFGAGFFAAGVVMMLMGIMAMAVFATKN